MAKRFERIVDEQKDRVFSFAFYYLGDRQEAEDVSQEVLLKLWRSFDSLEEEMMPRWLNRVTRNACFDLLRKRRVRRAVHDDSASEHAERIPSSEPDPGVDAERAQVRERIRALLAELPEPYRSAIILREIQELKYGEISELLEQPLNTVKAHIHRGRRMLREKLRQDAETGHHGMVITPQAANLR